MPQNVTCDRQLCRFISEDGDCLKYKITLDSDAQCEDYELKGNPDDQ